MRQKIAFLYSVPIVLWLSVFLAIPLILIALTSFRGIGPYGNVLETWTPEHYLRLLEPVYVQVIGISVGLASLTTVLTGILGFPVAYVMATSSKKQASIMFAMVSLPFLTNTLVRIYATRSFLAFDGVLNKILLTFGWISSPLMLTDSWHAVGFGMVTNYLPFMVLPIYSALTNFDFTLVEAATDLGASFTKTLRRVILPAIKPGVQAGSVLVFVPTLGEFMIPDLLGGAKVMLLGNLITNQFLKSRHWPFGAALAMVLVVFMVLSFMAFQKNNKKDLGNSAL